MRPEKPHSHLEYALKKDQVQNISLYVKNKNLKLHVAQRFAFQNYLDEQGLVPKRHLAQKFGDPIAENEKLLKGMVQRTKVTPGKLLVALKTGCRSLGDLATQSALDAHHVRKYVFSLQTYDLVSKVTPMDCLVSYLNTVKDYPLGKFKHRVLPWLRDSEKDDLRTGSLYVFNQPKLSFVHSMRVTGREFYINLANAAAQRFTERHKDAKCLNDMIREEFGLTPKIITFRKLEKTTSTEKTFEDKFRELVSSLIKKYNQNAVATSEEHKEDLGSGVLPDTLVTLPDGRRIAIELKRSSQGFYVDTSIKQFLRYLEVYDYVGIIAFHDLPAIAGVLGNKEFAGPQLLDALKKYFEAKTEEHKSQRNKYKRNLPVDHPDFCASVEATNTFLAYRYSRKQLDKFNPKYSVQVLLGPEAFDLFKPEYKPLYQKTLFFIGGATLAILCNGQGLKNELAHVRDFDNHLKEKMLKGKLSSSSLEALEP